MGIWGYKWETWGKSREYGGGHEEDGDIRVGREGDGKREYKGECCRERKGMVERNIMNRNMESRGEYGDRGG